MDLARATYDRIAQDSLAHALANRHRAVRSVAELPRHMLLDPNGDRVLVVANGPSLDAKRLEQRADLSIVVVDGALRRCLQARLRPDLVVSVDSHPRIAHWFGAAPDEHFARTGETAPPGTERYLRGTRVALATASHPRTVYTAEQAWMVPYWFHAMLDDPRAPDSLTRRLYEQHPLPVVNGGGNVGTTAWVIAHSILGAKDIALVGFDFGYPPDFPPERTQYAPELQTMYGADWRDAFTRYPSGWYSDPAMAWFREVFMEMAKDAPCRTVNCGDGTLGDAVERMDLADFLAL